MPAKFSISFRALVNKTLKRKGSKNGPTSSPAIASFTPISIITPKEETSEQGIDDAFHDPSVLDVHRSTKFGLNSGGYVELYKESAPMTSPVVSSLLSFPLTGRSPESSFSDPGTSSLASDASSVVSFSRSASPELGAARELHLADLKLIKLLSQGSSGQVFSAMDRVTRERRALKVIPHGGKLAPEILNILEEQTIMRSLNDLSSPYHLKLDASFCDTKNFYFVMPLHPTDIESEIIRCGKLDVERARFYFVEAYVGLVRLHKDGIIHRDIKPGNMLIDAEGHVVLADFGMSRDFGDFPTMAERMFQPFWPFARGDVITGPETPRRSPRELLFVTDLICGTVLHMSPECVMGKPYSFPADVWALGVSLYMMVTGRPPFDTPSDLFEDIQKEVLNTEVTFLPEDGVDEVTQDFICQLLRKNPNDRLRLTELEDHPFFSGINWPLFEKRAVPPPWVPGSQPTHILNCTARKFVPGVPFDGPSPYPIFDYTSDDIAAGVIRKADVIDPAEEPAEYQSEDSSPKLAVQPQPGTTPRPVPKTDSPIKKFFKELFSPKRWFRKPIPAPPLSPQAPDSSNETSPPPRSSPYVSSDSAPWASINFKASTPTSPVSASSPTPSPALISIKEGLWSTFRTWIKRLWIPHACPIPTSARCLDLLV